MTAANGIVLTYHNYIRSSIVTDIAEKHRFSLIIPMLIGLLMYSRLTKAYGWFARVPASLWIGVGAGYAFARRPAFTLRLIQSTFLRNFNNFNNIVLVIGVASVLAYFYFSVSGKSKAQWGIPRWSYVHVGIVRRDLWHWRHGKGLFAAWEDSVPAF